MKFTRCINIILIFSNIENINLNGVTTLATKSLLLLSLYSSLLFFKVGISRLSHCGCTISVRRPQHQKANTQKNLRESANSGLWKMNIERTTIY